ncbi:MAG: DUF2064 domain-containing protein [Chthoniobacterales bacterium]
MNPKPMTRRALLVFADPGYVDLARRGLPVAALPLLPLPAFKAEEMTADVHVFTSAPQTGENPRVHLQTGQGFAARFENAIETLTALGYDEIAAVGRDCPELSANDIALAFERLQENRLVLGPDHRGGCYLIAFRTAERALLRGVRWKRNTDCAQLCARGGLTQVALLPVKHDIDSLADLRLLAKESHVVGRLAHFLLSALGQLHSAPIQFIDAAKEFVRLHGQMPPPAFAG